MENIKKSNKYINPSLISGTIKQSKVFLIVWTVVILVFILLNLGTYLILQNIDLDEVQQLISNTNIFQFYVLGYDSDTLTLGLVFSSIVAMAALLKDESKNTTEFLFSHPISRKKMFLTKMLSFLSILFIFSLVIMGASFLMLAAFDNFDFDFNVGQYFVLHGGMFLMNLIFGLLMYGIASIKKGKNYFAISIMTCIVLYFVSMLTLFLTAALAPKFSWITNLNHLFIFNIMDTSKLVAGIGDITFNWQPIIIWAVPAIALNVWGYFRYQKKDLNCA
ncbi:MAG TPA: ABC transporter permease subunit [Clostridiales bacterium]|nr:ABC transporter permease subunit [Clostridiales bacterium]